MTADPVEYARPAAGAWHWPRWGALRLWFRAWRAGAGAEEAYRATRARGAPRDVAAGAAFEALTGNERPNLPPDARD